MAVQSAFDPHSELPSFDKFEFYPKQHRFALLIPVLNEGDRIRTQLKRIFEVKPDCDILILDGGSTDGALEHAYLTQYNVRTLYVKTGSGKLGSQIRIGLAEAIVEGYEGVILIDGNNKDNPNGINLFIGALENGYDHVQGSRFIKGGVAKNTPTLRYWGIKFLHSPMLSLAAGFRYTDTTNGFRAYSRKFLLDPKVAPLRHEFVGYELHYYLAIRAARLGYRVVEVPVERVYPKNEPTPTKIKGWKGNINVLRVLASCCMGKFNPPESR